MRQWYGLIRRQATRLAILMILFVLPLGGVRAQGSQPDGPVYVVQAGDTLWSVALRFGVSLDDLQTVNNLSNPNQLMIGMRLVIPGLEGVQGELTTVPVPFGETLRSLAQRYEVGEDILRRLNHLTRDYELVAGAELVIPMDENEQPGMQRALLGPGESLFELAVLQGVNPWSLVTRNNMNGSWQVMPGELVYIENAAGDFGPGALPGVVSSIELRPENLAQGGVLVLDMQAEPGTAFSGAFAGHGYEFFTLEDGRYVALLGVHAMTEVGIYPLTLQGRLADGRAFLFTQSVVITDGGYPYDPVLQVSEETIDPAVTLPEDAEWSALAQPVTAQRLWEGVFNSPVPAVFSECYPSRFGNRRSYNGSEYRYFHTGLDFCGQAGTEIYAPAAGQVVFAGPLTVRGNATMIDHGWGVYTAYMHQSEINVQPGEMVTPGQLIGLVGATGRVTGPHLHFEVWVGGVQVDPLDWLVNEYP